MFRIKKIFENLTLAIYRIEGKVTDESLLTWIQELNTLNQFRDRKIILDLCRAWSISPQALELLKAQLSNNIHDVVLINPGMEVRNTLHTAGLSARVLE
jgi:hypothetical protein